MFAPTTEEVIQSLGSLTKAELLLSSLFAHLDRVVPNATSRATLDAAIANAVKEAGLGPEHLRTVYSIISLQDPSAGDVLTRLTFKRGTDPRELNSIKNVFRDEAEIRCCGFDDTRDVLLGRLFTAMDNVGFKVTWQEAEKVFDRNCQLAKVSQQDNLKLIRLTPLGQTVATKVAGENAKGFSVVKEILEARATPRFIRDLADRLSPGCTLRSVNLSDAGAVSLLEKNSHILRQSVVTQISVEKDPKGKERVANSVIYIADKNDPQLYSHITHELLEVGLMQYILNRCHGTEIPTGFLVQFLAETKYSDTLVWSLQFQTLKDTFSRDESISILDRLFIVQFGAAETIAAVGRIVGVNHPLLQEMRLYQRIYSQVLQSFPLIDFKAATLEPHARPPQEQEKYGNFLLNFYGRIAQELSSQKNSEIGRRSILCNPELMLSEC